MVVLHFIAIYSEVFLLFCPHPSGEHWLSKYLLLPTTSLGKLQKLEAVFSNLASIRSPSVTAFNTGWVFKPVGLIIQRDNQSIIRSKALLLPWSACHSSIAWRAHKGATVSWEIRGLCREVLPPLSVNLGSSTLSVSDGQWERGGKGGLFLQKERHLPQPHPARGQTCKWVVTPATHVQTYNFLFHVWMKVAVPFKQFSVVRDNTGF